MIQYKNIGEMEKFKAENYPEIAAELSLILTGISYVPAFYKREIIISYLRDHCIKTEWIVANPDLTTLMRSGAVSTGNIERLFELCRWNKPFRTELEQYLAENLSR